MPERAGEQDALVRGARWLLLGGILLTPVVFDPKTADAFMLPKLLVLWAATISACALWLLSSRRRRWHLRGSKLAGAAAAYLAVFIFATLASESRLDSVIGSYERYGGLLSLALYLVAACLIVAIYSPHPAGLDQVALAVTVAAAAVSAYVLLQAAGVDWVVWHEPSGAVAKFHAGTMGNSDFAGGYLGLSLPFAAFELSKRRRRVVAGAAVVAVVAALVVTRSRGGLLAAVAGTAVFTACRPPGPSRWARRGLAAGAVVAIAAAGAFAVVVHFPRVSALDRTELLRSKSASVRAREWSAAWHVFAGHPLLGTGPETFRYEFPRHRGATDGRDLGLQVADKPHNVVLEHAADTGALGALGYLAVIGAALVFGVGRLRAVSNEERPLLAAFLATLVAYLAQGLVSIDVPPLALMGWVTLAGIAVLADPGLVAARAAGASAAPRASRASRDSRSVRSSPPSRHRPRSGPRALAPGLAVVAGTAVAVAVAVAAWPAAADLAAGTAQRHGVRGAALRQWDRAVALAPWQAAYRLDAGVSEESEAAGAVDASSRAGYLAGAERRYRDVLRLERLNLFAALGMARSETLWARAVDPTRFASAQGWWRRAIGEDPKDWEVHDGYALMLNSWANARGGDRTIRQQAVHELELTLAIKPDHVPALVNLAKLERALGDETEARAALERALRLDPANTEANHLLTAGSGPP